MTPDARELRIETYDYFLPDQRIARYPLSDRSLSKLLQYRQGSISEHSFRTLPELLPAGTLVVGNQTRVIHARLHFPVGGGDKTVEVFLLEPLLPQDYARSLGSTSSVSWKCLIGGNRRWKSGALHLSVNVGGRQLSLAVTRGLRTENTFEVSFRWGDPGLSFGEVVEAAGSIPLPPYLNRAAEAADHARYQTVFAEREGSVAAPTAGLHFTPEILAELQTKGIDWRALTLHVGAGTFKPVTANTLGGHVMHREYFSVPLDLLRVLRQRLLGGHPIVSVGTTSMRCLESLFYFGADLVLGSEESTRAAVLDQWVAHAPRYLAVGPAPALAALIDWLEREGRNEFTGFTQLLMTPAVLPRVVDGLITNFHQPRSTLLLLVAAMIGDDWKRVYQHALDNDFRFLSYGDSSLLWRRGGSAQ